MASNPGGNQEFEAKDVQLVTTDALRDLGRWIIEIHTLLGAYRACIEAHGLLPSGRTIAP